MRNEHNLDLGVANRTSLGQTFRNKLNYPVGVSKVTRQDTYDNLELSIKYFEKRVAEYKKALTGAHYFLKQIKSGTYTFDEACQVYWAMAFDPCSTHSQDIFLSLDPVYEALRDKFISLELGV